MFVLFILISVCCGGNFSLSLSLSLHSVIAASEVTHHTKPARKIAILQDTSDSTAAIPYLHGQCLCFFFFLLCSISFFASLAVYLICFLSCRSLASVFWFNCFFVFCMLIMVCLSVCLNDSTPHSTPPPLPRPPHRTHTHI